MIRCLDTDERIEEMHKVYEEALKNPVGWFLENGLCDDKFNLTPSFDKGLTYE